MYSNVCGLPFCIYDIKGCVHQTSSYFPPTQNSGSVLCCIYHVVYMCMCCIMCCVQLFCVVFVCVSVVCLCVVCVVCVSVCCVLYVCCRSGFKGGFYAPNSANAQATSLSSEDPKSTMHTLKVTIFSKLQEMGWRLGLCPRTRWGRIQHSPRPPSWILVLRARGKDQQQ